MIFRVENCYKCKPLHFLIYCTTIKLLLPKCSDKFSFTGNFVNLLIERGPNLKDSGPELSLGVSVTGRMERGSSGTGPPRTLPQIFRPSDPETCSRYVRLQTRPSLGPPNLRVFRVCQLATSKKTSPTPPPSTILPLLNPVWSQVWGTNRLSSLHKGEPTFTVFGLLLTEFVFPFI